MIIRLALLLALVSQISSALESVPKSIYKQRRLALSEMLHRRYALLFAESEGDYHSTFRQDNNFYYLTGWTQPGAALLVNLTAGLPVEPEDIERVMADTGQ